MAISVIIPTYRGRHRALRCIQSVLEQVRPPDELIVVDSSDDDTSGLIGERFPEVDLLHFEERVLYGDARNIGARKATGEVIAFTDDDCVVDKRWLQQLERPFVDPATYWAAGIVWPGNSSDPVAAADFWIAFSDLARRVGRRSVLTPAHYNIAYRREAFWDLGGFPADNLLSDHIFYKTCRDTYRDPLIVTTSVVYHYNPTDIEAVVARQRRVGHMFVDGRRSHGGLPGAALIRSRATWWMLPWIRECLFWCRLLRHFPKQMLRFVPRGLLIHRLFREWYGGVKQALAEGDDFSWRRHEWGGAAGAGREAADPCGADLPESGELLAPGASVGGRDPRGLE